MAARIFKQQVEHFQNPSNKFVVRDFSGDISWKLPSRGYVAINVDGAWDERTKEAGMGLCARNDEGLVVFVEANWKEELASSRGAEEWTLYRAMELAKEKRLLKAVFETDNAGGFNCMLQGAKADHQVSNMRPATMS
ncbi:hypothetical protein QQ045_013640 [Rhodiola kirilowii]